MILDNDKTFKVVREYDKDTQVTIADKLNDSNIASLVKQSYCAGFYDGYHTKRAGK